MWNKEYNQNALVEMLVERVLITIIIMTIIDKNHFSRQVNVIFLVVTFFPFFKKTFTISKLRGSKPQLHAF